VAGIALTVVVLLAVAVPRLVDSDDQVDRSCHIGTAGCVCIHNVRCHDGLACIEGICGGPQANDVVAAVKAEPGTTPVGGHRWCRSVGGTVTTDLGHIAGVWAAKEDDVWLLQRKLKALNSTWVGAPTTLGVSTWPVLIHRDGRSFCATPLNYVSKTFGGGNFNAIWGTSSSDVWAVGAKGLALHWNGRSWKSEPTGTSLNLTDISGTSSNNVFAVAGGILRWDGTRWSPYPVAGLSGIVDAIWISPAGRIWAQTRNAGGCNAFVIEEGNARCVLRLRPEQGFRNYSIVRITGHDETPWVLVKEFVDQYALKFKNPGWDNPAKGHVKTQSLKALLAISSTEVWLGYTHSVGRWDGSRVIYNSVPMFGSALGDYGFWGTSSDDVWVFGRDFYNVYHWNGKSWKKW
jgi:hypothetical protein